MVMRDCSTTAKWQWKVIICGRIKACIGVAPYVASPANNKSEWSHVGSMQPPLQSSLCTHSTKLCTHCTVFILCTRYNVLTRNPPCSIQRCTREKNFKVVFSHSCQVQCIIKGCWRFGMLYSNESELIKQCCIRIVFLFNSRMHFEFLFLLIFLCCVHSNYVQKWFIPMSLYK